MALGLEDLEYLSDNGHLRSSARILDIGSQNLLNLEPVRTRALIAKLGGNPVSDAGEVTRICETSVISPGVRTTYLSEFFDLTNVFYASFDVCPALKTEIFDLNFEAVPEHHRGRFDLVMNYGTTEHVLNQYNAMKVIHDALAVDGVVIHNVPSTGWAGHGYVCYHEEFFKDLAAANAYDVVDLWYTRTGSSWFDSDEFDFRSPVTPQKQRSGRPNEDSRMVASSNVCCVMRKREALPFRISLELATSHTAAAETIAAKYRPRHAISSMSLKARAHRLLRLMA